MTSNENFSSDSLGCPNCSRPVHRSDRFCPYCGAALSPEAPHSATDSVKGSDVICPNCAHTLRGAHKFCPACGTTLSAAPSTSGEPTPSRQATDDGTPPTPSQGQPRETRPPAQSGETYSPSEPTIGEPERTLTGAETPHSSKPLSTGGSDHSEDVPCPGCGKLVNPGSIFCPDCGQRLQGQPEPTPPRPSAAAVPSDNPLTPPTPNPPQTIKCPHCAAQTDNRLQYCSYCGGPLRANPQRRFFIVVGTLCLTIAVLSSLLFVTQHLSSIPDKTRITLNNRKAPESANNKAAAPQKALSDHPVMSQPEAIKLVALVARPKSELKGYILSSGKRFYHFGYLVLQNQLSAPVTFMSANAIYETKDEIIKRDLWPYVVVDLDIESPDFEEVAAHTLIDLARMDISDKLFTFADFKLPPKNAPNATRFVGLLQTWSPVPGEPNVSAALEITFRNDNTGQLITLQLSLKYHPYIGILSEKSMVEEDVKRREEEARAEQERKRLEEEKRREAEAREQERKRQEEEQQKKAEEEARRRRAEEDARRKREICAKAPSLRKQVVALRDGISGKVDHLKAKELLDQAAEAGDTVSIGMQYAFKDSWVLPPWKNTGISQLTPLSPELIETLTHLARTGDPEASFVIGTLNLQVNSSAATTDLIRGANQKYLPALTQLANYYLAQSGQDSFKKALFYLETALRQGSVEAALTLANLYHTGTKVTTNTTEAITYYIFAAERQHPVALYILGSLYYTGAGVPKNPEKALELLSQSADAGYPVAIKTLPNLYYSYATSLAAQRSSQASAMANAAKYAQLALDSGFIQYAGLLAQFYKNGEGLPRHCSNAAFYAQLGANAGDPYAKVVYACCLCEGCDVQRDFSKGIQLLTECANAGSPEAMYALHQAYKPGNSFVPDAKISKQWLEKAKNAGYPLSESDQAFLTSKSQMQGAGPSAAPSTVRIYVRKLVNYANGPTAR